MKLVASLRSKYVAWRKHGHKHLVVSRKLIAYIDNLLRLSEHAVVAERSISSKLLPHSHLQSEYTETRFISVLIDAVRAKHVLELGTFRGFMTVQAALRVGEDGCVVTCDSRQPLIEEARIFAREAGVENRIEFLCGNAVQVSQNLVEKGRKFDMIFIDADKLNYRTYVDASYELIRSGGVILIDNSLWGGLVAETKGLDRTAQAIKEVGEYVSDKFGSNVAIIPAWDGVTMIVVNK